MNINTNINMYKSIRNITLLMIGSVVAFVVFSLSMSVHASAATLTWTGANAVKNTAHADNWAPAQVPTNDDVLIFNVSPGNGIVGQDFDIDNGLPNLAIGGISVIGSGGTFELTGSPVTLSGTLNSPTGAMKLYLNMHLGGDLIVVGQQTFGDIGAGSLTGINMNGHTLTFNGSSTNVTFAKKFLAGNGLSLIHI